MLSQAYAELREFIARLNLTDRRLEGLESRIRAARENLRDDWGMPVSTGVEVTWHWTLQACGGFSFRNGDIHIFGHATGIDYGYYLVPGFTIDTPLVIAQEDSLNGLDVYVGPPPRFNLAVPWGPVTTTPSAARATAAAGYVCGGASIPLKTPLKLDDTRAGVTGVNLTYNAGLGVWESNPTGTNPRYVYTPRSGSSTAHRIAQTPSGFNTANVTAQSDGFDPQVAWDVTFKIDQANAPPYVIGDPIRIYE